METTEPAGYRPIVMGAPLDNRGLLGRAAAGDMQPDPEPVRQDLVFAVDRIHGLIERAAEHRNRLQMTHQKLFGERPVSMPAGTLTDKPEGLVEALHQRLDDLATILAQAEELERSLATV